HDLRARLIDYSKPKAAAMDRPCYKAKKPEADRLPVYGVVHISGFYNPTVHPLAHSGVSTPAPAPVAEASSVKTALTSTASPAVFFPLDFTSTFSNFTRVAFSDPSAT